MQRAFSHNNLEKSTYRPDIDGLRAIAILPVVGFHAFPNWLKGGFVGVDIFFVISGFLISSIIFENLVFDNFSITKFYVRRIKRIFPALLLVLMISYLLGYFILFPDEFKQLGKHIVGGSIFISNLVLWRETGYFDNISETKPLLHLWSLGIEEQFYILWPLILWFTYKKNINFFVLALTILFISFSLNVYHTQSSFYLPQSRIWELMIGSVLAYVVAFKQSMLRNTKPKYASFFSVLGAVLIFLSIVFIDKDKNFPGWWALMPTLGGGLIILGGSCHSWLNKTILTNKILRWFGWISFPLYLYHWPLLSFLYIYNGGTPPRAERLLAISLAIAMAWLTYQFIESPIRFKKNSSIMPLVICMFLVGFAGYLSFRFDGITKRFDPITTKKQYPENKKINFDGYDQHPIFRDVIPLKDRDFFLYNASSPEQADIAIIGDSHANRIYSGLKETSHYKMLNIGRGTCPSFINVEVKTKTNALMDCQPLTNIYLNYVKNNKNIKLLIINAFFNQYNRDFILTKQGRVITLNDAIYETISFLADSNKIIIFVLDVPEIPRTTLKRNFPAWLFQEEYDHRIVDYFSHIQKKEILNSTLILLQKKYPNIYVYDPTSLFCTKQYCGEIDTQNYLYLDDGNHLNNYGMKKLAISILNYLKNIYPQDMSYTAPT